jgi:transferase hexapeptide repeat
LQWLGDDDVFMSRYPDMPVHIAVVMGCGGSLSVRRRLIERYAAYASPVLISSSALVTPSSKIGDGCAIMHRAVVNGAEIGAYSVINTGAILEHGVIAGSNLFVGPGAIVCGGVRIGDDVMIGAGAVVRNNVAIPSNTIIGMGSVVTASIYEPGTYVGVPAKLVKKL